MKIERDVQAYCFAVTWNGFETKPHHHGLLDINYRACVQLILHVSPRWPVLNRQFLKNPLRESKFVHRAVSKDISKICIGRNLLDESVQNLLYVLGHFVWGFLSSK